MDPISSAKAPHPIRVAMEQMDVDAVLRCFAPRFVLRSPVTRVPFTGADSHRLLRAVLESYERWECLAEFGDDHELVLITRTRIGGREVQVVDHMLFGPEGTVVDFTGYARPLDGTATFASVVAPRIAAERGRSRRSLVAALTRPVPAIIRLADTLVSTLAAMHSRA
jgi:hypothetical protein